MTARPYRELRRCVHWPPAGNSRTRSDVYRSPQTGMKFIEFDVAGSSFMIESLVVARTTAVRTRSNSLSAALKSP
jgi:hypothetical protein